MRQQLFINSEEPREDRVDVIKNFDSFINKPEGGIWTSSYVNGKSDWFNWCDAEGFGKPYENGWFILTPASTAKILIIDSVSDLKKMPTDYSYPDNSYVACYLNGTKMLDFERISRDFDAINVTKNFIMKPYDILPEPGISLDAWDCESTLWFRWCFDSVEKINPQKDVSL